MSFILITYILILYICYKCGHESFVSSRVDNKTYKVLGGFENQQDAADRLALVNKKNIDLINYLINKYQEHGTLGYTLATRLKKRYKSDRLVENDPPDKDNTSFTEDKGEKIALCLREKITGKNRLHDQHIIEYVNLHELAHIASEGWGHEDEFWSNFAFLLKEAMNAGIHNPRDYSKNPVNYCGLDVNYSPFYNQ
jgi:hypothetical protein